MFIFFGFSRQSSLGQSIAIVVRDSFLSGLCSCEHTFQTVCNQHTLRLDLGTVSQDVGVVLQHVSFYKL